MFLSVKLPFKLCFFCWMQWTQEFFRTRKKNWPAISRTFAKHFLFDGMLEVSACSCCRTPNRWPWAGICSRCHAGCCNRFNKIPSVSCFERNKKKTSKVHPTPKFANFLPNKCVIHFANLFTQHKCNSNFKKFTDTLIMTSHKTMEELEGLKFWTKISMTWVWLSWKQRFPRN